MFRHQSMTIEDLVDFPALQQLAHALWHEGTSRGAAVLIGAGFSRYSDRQWPTPALTATIQLISALCLARLDAHAVSHICRWTNDHAITWPQPATYFDIAAVIRFKLKLAKLDLAVG